jgi:serine/threonine protein kinase
LLIDIIAEIQLGQYWLLYKDVEFREFGIRSSMLVQPRLFFPKLGTFNVLKLLGKGAYGNVWKVEQHTTGESFALKVLHKHEILKNNHVEHINLERHILEFLGGQRSIIVQLYDSFQTTDRIYLLMEVISLNDMYPSNSQLNSTIWLPVCGWW